MLFKQPIPTLSKTRLAIVDAYHADETRCIEDLLAQIDFDNATIQNIQAKAIALVKHVRNNKAAQGGVDSLMQTYDLSSHEGIVLMCLAEALLRIPDKKTMELLIQDKLTQADWRKHLGQSGSIFVNAATWGLLLTGKLLQGKAVSEQHLSTTLMSFLGKTSAPVIRQSIMQAMRILGQYFVMGQTIEKAVQRAKEFEKIGYSYSYDMLGEAARTQEDAEKYFIAYQEAIKHIGSQVKYDSPAKNPGISVKLSALSPRYEFTQGENIIADVVAKLTRLAEMAKSFNIGLTVDAEEASRLDLSLDIIEATFSNPALQGWDGFGVAVQSYQKRGIKVLDWLIELAKTHDRRIMIRLIKGAYWDTEIKDSQVQGFSGYPVFTRKASTDVSFIACAKKLLEHTHVIYPQFATHNASSIATVLVLAEKLGKNNTDYEFQRLHGMGQALYDQIVGESKLNIPCRIYAPVGGHKDLLAYLVRRLLENGANTSFVNRLTHADESIEQVVANPIEYVKNLAHKPHPHIPIPKNIYGDERKNSSGFDVTNYTALTALQQGMAAAMSHTWSARPTTLPNHHNEKQTVINPACRQETVGYVYLANTQQVNAALDVGVAGFAAWDKTPVTERAALLEKTADLLESQQITLIALSVKEAGKTIPDAIAEVREAVDFCRYYAACARKTIGQIQILPGPTGEHNQLSLHGRGLMVCISPWNFPLAIFVGQIVAALVAGNTVIAKPAEQTPLIAAYAIELMHQAGIPKKVVQLLPGQGSKVGGQLIADARIAGVIFTGSTETAQTINRSLAAKPGAIVPFIAETGGQNAMIVDSTALLEQVTFDILHSAFGSAGQRCSALRVLYVQDDIADKLLHMLKGAMAEIKVDDPVWLNTDIGPVIDDDAKSVLEEHIKIMSKEASLTCKVDMPDNTYQGSFVAPHLFVIDNIQQLSREVFGPILHVIRYQTKNLDKVISDINNTGYGLTFGVHSRINSRVDEFYKKIHAGNLYVNRNMVGAVVGVQPFGGERLSGTGPKAGGPYYLYRLCTEKTLCVNTTAAGGNASLLSLEE